MVGLCVCFGLEPTANPQGSQPIVWVLYADIMERCIYTQNAKGSESLLRGNSQSGRERNSLVKEVGIGLETCLQGKSHWGCPCRSAFSSLPAAGESLVRKQRTENKETRTLLIHCFLPAWQQRGYQNRGACAFFTCLHSRRLGRRKAFSLLLCILKPQDQ